MVMVLVVLDRDVGVRGRQGVVEEGCRNAEDHDLSAVWIMMSFAWCWCV